MRLSAQDPPPVRRVPQRVALVLFLAVVAALGIAVWLYVRSAPPPSSSAAMDDTAAKIPAAPPAIARDNSQALQAMRAQLDTMVARGSPDDLAQAALVARRMGDLWREQKLLGALLKARPQDHTVHLWAADALTQQARFAQARAVYLRLLSEDRTDTQVYLGLADLATVQANRAEAWEWLAKGARDGPQTAESLTSLARRYQDWNDFPNAKAALETAMRIAPNDPGPQLGMASLCLQHGDVGASRRILEGLIREHPDGSAYRLLATALIVPSEPDPDFARARVLLEKAADLNPKDPDIYRVAGIVYMHLKLNRLAAQCYDALLTLDPSSADARYNLGQAYLALGKTDLGRQQVALSVQLRARARKATLAGTAVSDHPTDPNLHTGYGEALEQNGDLSGALRQYQVALGLSERCRKARAGLERIYARLGWGKPELKP